jgi:hypothetical protein
VPPTYAPVQPAKRSTWWIVPLVIVGLVVIAWLLLAVLPFGGRDEEAAENAPATETIAEGTTTAQGQPMTGTLIEVPGVDEPGTTQTSAPPMEDDTATIAPLSPTPVPEQPRVIEEPGQPQSPPAPTTPAPAPTPRPATPRPTPVPATPRPAPVPATPRPATPRPTPVPAAPRPATPTQPQPQPRPAPATPAPTGEISEAEAGSTLRGYINSSNYYDGVSGNCLSVRSHGYRNVGYTFSVWDGCVSGGGSRMLGRWRVDSKTREVFRQRDDGRFLRP